jgi:SAM-dependent methyltransferase
MTEKWQAIETLAKQKAPDIARKIREAIQDLPNEATFRSRIQPIVEDFCQMAGVTVLAQHERTLASGRADTVFNRLVVEYKAPGILSEKKNAKANRAAIDKQLKPYINDLAKSEKHRVDRIAGVVLDGRYYIFLRRVGDVWYEDEPLPVDGYSTERFLRMLVSLASGVALTAKNLIVDFGIQTMEDPRKRIKSTQVNIRTQRLLRAMVNSIERHVADNAVGSQAPLVKMLFEQWKTSFSEVIEYKEAFSGPKFRALGDFARKVGVDLKDQNEALYFFFAVHTYFALLVKLLAWLALSRHMGVRLGVPAFSRLAELPSEELRRYLRRMEEGAIFADYGIRNLLEGDFFCWYAHAWDERLEGEIRELLKRLSDYDPTTLEVNPEETRDLLKKLYHYLMPREIRHNLGEYYTPDWLAQRLLNQVDFSFFHDDPERSRYVRENLLKLRFLDPGCGSGTFLVLIIQRIRDAARQLMLPEKEVLQAILRNVVGIDLNPLAVIAARTNYLLALVDLLEHSPGDVSIPVYLADSIVTPAKGEDMFSRDKYFFKTSVGEFAVPEEVVKRDRLNRLADLIDESVRAGVFTEVFLERCQKELNLDSQEMLKAGDGLKTIYEHIADLHRQGMNGVWARILKNYSAPLFMGQFDYIVGNPPWVNWENLPDGYRDETKKSWVYHGLFPHGGMDTILGKGKKDIAMLMTYVSMQEYLKNGGKLGFVITQSVFKTSGAGQGFRRFKLGDGTPLRVLSVDDMTKLQPFEGAANRTAVIVLQKGQPNRYNFKYVVWRKRTEARGKGIGFDHDLEEVEALTQRLLFRAEPVDTSDVTSPWLTGRPRALQAIRKVLGKSYYEAHAGVYTGGANAVYWLEIVGKGPGNLVMVANIIEGAKRKVEPTQAMIEPDLLYPLLRGRDVQRWVAKPSGYILMVQDPVKRRGIAEEEMQRHYMKTWEYLKNFEKELRQRASRGVSDMIRNGAPFYTIFAVGDYTFKPYKVAWPWISESVRAAVVHDQDGKPILPEHNCSFVGLDREEEAHFVCSLLNSSIVDYAIRAFYSGGGGGIASPAVLQNIRIPKFDSKDKMHAELSDLSLKAHYAMCVGKEVDLNRLEKRIDVLAAKVFGVTEAELVDVQRSLRELDGEVFER